MMIKQYSHEFPVRMMCEMLQVSPSSYYSWIKRPVPARDKEREKLANAIITIFHAEKARVGYLRITKRLHRQGIKVGKNRVAGIMRDHGLCAKAAKKFKATTNSNHNLPPRRPLIEN